jgi:hypothetical protein
LWYLGSRSFPQPNQVSATVSVGEVGARQYIHIVRISNLPLLIPDNGEREVAPGDFVNVLDPLVVRGDCICREADELGATFDEFGFKLGEGPEFGGADWGKV